MKFAINVKSISLKNEVNAQRSKRAHFQPASTKTQMPEVEKIICVATAHTHKIKQTNKQKQRVDTESAFMFTSNTEK